MRTRCISVSQIHCRLQACHLTHASRVLSLVVVRQTENITYQARKAVLLGAVAVGAVFCGDQGSAGAYISRAQMHLKDCFDALLPEVRIDSILFFLLAPAPAVMLTLLLPLALCPRCCSYLWLNSRLFLWPVLALLLLAALLVPPF